MVNNVGDKTQPCGTPVLAMYLSFVSECIECFTMNVGVCDGCCSLCVSVDYVECFAHV